MSRQRKWRSSREWARCIATTLDLETLIDAVRLARPTMMHRATPDLAFGWELAEELVPLLGIKAEHAFALVALFGEAIRRRLRMAEPCGLPGVGVLWTKSNATGSRRRVKVNIRKAFREEVDASAPNVDDLQEREALSRARFEAFIAKYLSYREYPKREFADPDTDQITKTVARWNYVAELGPQSLGGIWTDRDEEKRNERESEEAAADAGRGPVQPRVRRFGRYTKDRTYRPSEPGPEDGDRPRRKLGGTVPPGTRETVDPADGLEDEDEDCDDTPTKDSDDNGQEEGQDQER